MTPGTIDPGGREGPVEGAVQQSTVRPAAAPESGPIELFLAARPSPMLRAVVLRLGELGRTVVAISPGRALERLAQLEPGLVVLDLEACTRTELVRAVHARALPIVVLGRGAQLRTAIAARSLGARQVIDSAYSVEQLTQDLVHAVVAGAPTRAPLAFAQTTTLRELLGTLEQELRASLARYSRVPARGDLRFRLRDPELIATYLRRLRAALSRVVADVVPAPCELTGEPIPLSSEVRAERWPLEPLAGARFVLVDPRVSRVDAMAAALRAVGGTVFPCAPEELLGELSRIAELDPTAILVEEELGGTVERLLAEIGGESRLRFTRLIAAPLGELWDAADRALDTLRLLELVSPAHLEERAIAERLRAQPRQVMDLATVGPGRLLHAVALAATPTRLTHVEASCLLRVEFASEGIVAGASARLPDRNRLEGPAALAVFLRRTKGTVDIQRLVEPSLVSVLAPVADAIGMAMSEPIPVVNSSFPPGPVTRLSWSNMPGPMAGRITWTSIPAISPEELSAYAIKDPSELLDAVEDDDDDEPPTVAFDPSRVAGPALRMRPLPVVEAAPAPTARAAAAEPASASPSSGAPAAEPVAEPVAEPPVLEEPTEPLPAVTPRAPRATRKPVASGGRRARRQASAAARREPRDHAPRERREAPASAAAPRREAGGLSPQFVGVALFVALLVLAMLFVLR